MKDHLRELVDRRPGDVIQKTCVAREYLQARILQSFQEEGVFTRWVFQGGTALRFIYGLPRFSEDLDFSLVQHDSEHRFGAVIRHACSTFEAEGYTLNTNVKDEKTVATAFLRFSGLPYELGLSPNTDQALAVRVELDTNPPQGGRPATTMVRRHVLLHLQHHDQASLLARKLHAVLSRPWCKGRDLYDLAWYLSDREWPPPNFPFLNAALRQTEWSGPSLSEDNWRSVVAERVRQIDFRAARNDVRPFLERPADVELLECEALVKLLTG
jgi:predicted nucleotidyltransferase component of viral defense system